MYYRITDQSEKFLMSRLVLYTDNNTVAQVYYSWNIDELEHRGREWAKTSSYQSYPPFIVRYEYFTGKYTVRDMRNFIHNQYLYTPYIKTGNGQDNYSSRKNAENRARLFSHIIGSLAA